MRGALPRWFLLATAVAFVLLGRPSEGIATPRTEDEQASCGAGDDVSLRSGRRPSTVIRMVGYDLDDDWSTDFEAFERDVVAPSAARRLAIGPLEHEALEERLSSSSSARGPPVIWS